MNDLQSLSLFPPHDENLSATQVLLSPSSLIASSCSSFVNRGQYKREILPQVDSEIAYCHEKWIAVWKMMTQEKNKRPWEINHQYLDILQRESECLLLFFDIYKKKKEQVLLLCAIDSHIPDENDPHSLPAARDGNHWDKKYLKAFCVQEYSLEYEDKSEMKKYFWMDGDGDEDKEKEKAADKDKEKQKRKGEEKEIEKKVEISSALNSSSLHKNDNDGDHDNNNNNMPSDVDSHHDKDKDKDEDNAMDTDMDRELNLKEELELECPLKKKIKVECKGEEEFPPSDGATVTLESSPSPSSASTEIIPNSSSSSSSSLSPSPHTHLSPSASSFLSFVNTLRLNDYYIDMTYSIHPHFSLHKYIKKFLTQLHLCSGYRSTQNHKMFIFLLLNALGFNDKDLWIEVHPTFTLKMNEEEVRCPCDLSVMGMERNLVVISLQHGKEDCCSMLERGEAQMVATMMAIAQEKRNRRVEEKERQKHFERLRGEKQKDETDIPHVNFAYGLITIDHKFYFYVCHIADHLLQCVQTYEENDMETLRKSKSENENVLYRTYSGYNHCLMYNKKEDREKIINILDGIQQRMVGWSSRNREMTKL